MNDPPELLARYRYLLIYVSIVFTVTLVVALTGR